MTPICPMRSKVLLFQRTSPKLPSSVAGKNADVAQPFPDDQKVDEDQQNEECRKNEQRQFAFRNIIAPIPGHGDGGDEQHGDQAGHHRYFEDADIRAAHPKEENGQKDAGHGQLIAALSRSRESTARTEKTTKPISSRRCIVVS